MLHMEDLREIAKIEGNGAWYVSLYLNVNPLTNPKGEYAIWLKNALKDKASSLDNAVLKHVEKDLSDIDAYVQGNRRGFKKGLVLLRSRENSFAREFDLSLPIKNELVVDKAPYIKPMLQLIDGYKRYAVLLVEKDSARIFIVQLGEITEYGEVQTPDVPGKHKKGGWYALSQNHYARHVDYHVTLHLKEVVKKLESFLKGEYVGRVVIGGPPEAVSMTKGILPAAVADKIAGSFNAGMFENNADILKKVAPLLDAFERQKETVTVSELITRSKKNDKAVIGLDGVIDALREGKIMKLVFIKDYARKGYQCSNCKTISISGDVNCRYCGGRMAEVDYLIDLAAQKAVEQDSAVEVVAENDDLKKAGSIGAFLRF